MKPLYHGTIYDFEEIDVSAGKGYKKVIRILAKDSMPPQFLHMRRGLQSETRASQRNAKAFSKTKRE